MRRLLLPLLLLLAATLAEAAVKPAFVFTDGLVLQHGKPAPVWGVADAGEEIVVRFAGHERRARADAGGRWRIDLPALAASSEPRTLEITGSSSGDAIRLRDVLVGDVWLASGQSNMEWPVSKSDRAQEEIAAAHHPLIREFAVNKTVAEAPGAPGASKSGWRVCSPGTVGDFSAVAYHFAREMHRADGVPVGIINASWGGTQIESWIPPEALAADADLAFVGQRWAKTLADHPALTARYDADMAAWRVEDAAARAEGKQIKRRAPRRPPGPGHQLTPSSLHNGMIGPLAPFALTGFLWYQGEENVFRHREYAALFQTLVTSWRAAFGQGDLPFYFVQLPNFDTVRDPTRQVWAFLREAQARALSLPATECAVIIDLGEAREVHPANKREVGRRLALIAQNKLRGTGVEFSGPRLAEAAFSNGEARIRFTHTTGGLRLGPAPLTGLEIAGPDRRFHFPAQARVEGDTLVVWSPQVPEPAAVRYAWRNDPALHLTNGEGLPAMPFRTDDWE